MGKLVEIKRRRVEIEKEKSAGFGTNGLSIRNEEEKIKI